MVNIIKFIVNKIYQMSPITIPVKTLYTTVNSPFVKFINREFSVYATGAKMVCL